MEANRMMLENISPNDFEFVGDFLYINHGVVRRWLALSDLFEISYCEEDKKLYVHYREGDTK